MKKIIICILLLAVFASLFGCVKENAESSGALASSTAAQSTSQETKNNDAANTEDDLNKSSSSKNDPSKQAPTQGHTGIEEETKRTETVPETSTQSYDGGIVLPEDEF